MWLPRAMLYAMPLALAAGSPPEVGLLARFKARLDQDLARVPDYTCLQTTERYRRHLGSNPFELQDTVRLEVVHVGDKELVTPPGSPQFGDQDARSMAVGGLMSTGIFATFVRRLFLWDAGAFQYHGEEKRDGRRLMRYDFHLPQDFKGLSVTTSSGSAMLATKGSFWFDAASVDLVRVEGHGDEIPANLHLAKVLLRIDYARIHIPTGDALLAQRAELEMTYNSGEASRNITTFSGCRQYGSASTIHFDTPPR